ncbi:hypothetical protein [Cyanobium sp. NS01]|uniref:hypothetical protein n=1 Tax=Cyanobium sp. NS01 TaxID=261284 RepID=UPI0016458AB2|nr:hypothetical protein [Cyanobium sp. NS01]QNI69445.1 hypothetical protein CyaNS01_00284 [Cyanobium sp. NS01]
MSYRYECRKIDSGLLVFFATENDLVSDAQSKAEAKWKSKYAEHRLISDGVTHNLDISLQQLGILDENQRRKIIEILTNCGMIYGQLRKNKISIKPIQGY